MITPNKCHFQRLMAILISLLIVPYMSGCGLVSTVTKQGLSSLRNTIQPTTPVVESSRPDFATLNPEEGAIQSVAFNRASSGALIIGIENYQDQAHMQPMKAAVADATGVAAALRAVSGLPAANIHLLTSDSKNNKDKPTRDNIWNRIQMLAAQVSPGGVAFVLFCGHGMVLDGNSLLLPYDADARSDAALLRTAMSLDDFKAAFTRLRAKTLVLAFDMSRGMPRPAAKGFVPHNLLTQRQVVDAQFKDSYPNTVVAFFSCAPGESSQLRPDQKRGYFADFLEQGLRQGGADSNGMVLLKPCFAYVKKAVYGTALREQGERQVPFGFVSGPDLQTAAGLALALKRPPGSGGTTAVPLLRVPAATRQYEETMQQGYELRLEKKWTEAQAQFEAALQLNPQSSRAHTALGNINKDVLNNPEEAERLYRKAIELDAKDANPVENLAMLLRYQKKDLTGAEQLFQRALQLNPRRSQPATELGLMHVKSNPSKAAHFYRQAMQIAPSNPWPPYNLAVVLNRDFGDSRGAQKLYRRAMEINPRFVWAAQNLSNLRLYVQNDPGTAALVNQRTPPPNPTNLNGTILLAHLYRYHQERWQQGEQLYRRAMQMNPNDPRPYRHLGIFYTWGLENRTEGERLLRQALSLDPRDAVTVYNLGLIKETSQDFISAIPLYQQAMKLDPRWPTPVYALGNLMHHQKRSYRQAEKFYRQAMQLDPLYAAPVLGLANLTYYVKADAAGAELLYRKAIALNPGEGANHAEYARLLLDQNRVTEARSVAQMALDVGFKDTAHPIYSRLNIPS